MNKILIRGVNWIGDAIMTLPSMRSFRKEFKDNSISMLVKPWVSPVFEKDPNIDKIIEYKDEYRGISGMVKIRKLLKSENFSRAFLLQNALDAAIITFIAGIKERVGYNTDARGLLLTRSIPVNKDILKLHHIKYYLNLLKDYGISTEYKLPWLYLELSERLIARKLMSHLKRPLIGLNPGATYGSAKRWPSRKFAGIIEKVLNDIGGSIILFGSQKETETTNEIINMISPDIVDKSNLLNLSGRTTLRELSALISECDMLLTNDSGPMHISYAVGTNVAALFGSTDDSLTGPPDFDQNAEFGFKKTIFKKDIDCSPCFKRSCRYGHLRCMEEITEEEVYDKLSNLVPDKKALFFDRDGTLCKDANYLNKFEDLEIFPEIKTLPEFKKRGYKLIGISNQSGIAKGIVDEEFVVRVNKFFIEKYGFDDFYYCPHNPDDNCACRKPEPGMLYKSSAEHNIDIKNSFFIGDKVSDMLTAKAVGAAPIFLKNEIYPLTISGIEKINRLDELNSIV